MADRTVLRAFLNDEISFTECLEILAALAGQKRVVRLTGFPDRLENLAALTRSIGLAHAVAPMHLELQFDNVLEDRFFSFAPGRPGPGQEGVLFAGGQAAVELAEDMELRGCPSMEAADLYGYPPCCARNYDDSIQRKTYWVDSFLAGARGVVRAPWPMNRLGRLFAPHVAMLPDYFPCNINCADSRRLAENYAALLARTGLGSLLDLAREHLARPVLKHEGCLYWLRPWPVGESAPEGPLFEARVTDFLAYAGAGIPAKTLTLVREPGGGLAVQESLPRKAGTADTVLLLFE